MAGETPLYVDGEYSLYPLRVCEEHVIAKLFVKISQRGNPILKGKPEADLEFLGGALYRKAVGSPFSVVFLLGNEPVSLFFAWDAGSGGMWGPDLQPPPSLRAHRAVGEGAWRSLPQPNPPPLGRTIFLAFGGVLLPHPGKLLWIASSIVMQMAVKAGYLESFSYSTHEKTIAGAKQASKRSGIQTWTVAYSSIEVDDDKVREELANLDIGSMECMLSDMWRVRCMTRVLGDGCARCVMVNMIKCFTKK